MFQWKIQRPEGLRKANRKTTRSIGVCTVSAALGAKIFQNHWIIHSARSRGSQLRTIILKIHTRVGCLSTEAALRGAVVLDDLEGIVRAGTEAVKLVVSTVFTESMIVQRLLQNSYAVPMDLQFLGGGGTVGGRVVTGGGGGVVVMGTVGTALYWMVKVVK